MRNFFFKNLIICAINYYSFQVSTLFEKVCGRSAEYLHVPETVQCMLPPLLMNNEQTRETILGRWPMVFPSFLSATEYLSGMFRTSLFACKSFSYNSQPDCLVNVVATNAQISSILVLHVGSACDSESACTR